MIRAAGGDVVRGGRGVEELPIRRDKHPINTLHGGVCELVALGEDSATTVQFKKLKVIEKVMKATHHSSSRRSLFLFAA
jgi:hypothetical protein